MKNPLICQFPALLDKIIYYYFPYALETVCWPVPPYILLVRACSYKILGSKRASTGDTQTGRLLALSKIKYVALGYDNTGSHDTDLFYFCKVVV